MSLPAREQHVLNGIEAALQAGETGLTSMFAIFTRLVGDEGRPGTEQLAPGSRSPGNWLKGPYAIRPRRWRAGRRPAPLNQWATGRPVSRWRAIALIPVAVATVACVVLLSVSAASARPCGPVIATRSYQRVASPGGTCPPSPSPSPPAPRPVR